MTIKIDVEEGAEKMVSTKVEELRGAG